MCVLWWGGGVVGACCRLITAHEKPQLRRLPYSNIPGAVFFTFIVSMDVPSPMHDPFTWARNNTFRPNQFVFHYVCSVQIVSTLLLFFLFVTIIYLHICR